MDKAIKLAVAVLLFIHQPAAAAAYWVTGTIVDVTSTTSGLFVRITGAMVPDNCVGAPSGWMQISSTDQVMVATVLSLWLTGRKDFAIYTSSTSGDYCHVIQADPLE